MKEFTRLHSPSLSWASVPLLPGTLALLSGGGFHNSSEVTLVAPDGTKHITPALDASTAALKFKMPDEPGPPPHLFSTSSALLLHSFCTPSSSLHPLCRRLRREGRWQRAAPRQRARYVRARKLNQA